MRWPRSPMSRKSRPRPSSTPCSAASWRRCTLGRRSNSEAHAAPAPHALDIRELCRAGRLVGRGPGSDAPIALVDNEEAGTVDTQDSMVELAEPAVDASMDVGIKMETDGCDRVRSRPSETVAGQTVAGGRLMEIEKIPGGVEVAAGLADEGRVLPTGETAPDRARGTGQRPGAADAVQGRAGNCEWAPGGRRRPTGSCRRDAGRGGARRIDHTRRHGWTVRNARLGDAAEARRRSGDRRGVETLQGVSKERRRVAARTGALDKGLRDGCMPRSYETADEDAGSEAPAGDPDVTGGRKRKRENETPTDPDSPAAASDRAGADTRSSPARRSR